MGIQFPTLHPQPGDFVAADGRFVRILGRPDQPEGRDTFTVREGDEERAMHIDELSELVGTADTLMYLRNEGRGGED